MKNYKYKFIEFLINRQVLQFGKFILKSGRISPYFFNIGALNTGLDLLFLGKVYATMIIKLGIKFNMLFSPAYKGIPIVISTAIALSKYFKLNVPYAFSRKENKNYGEVSSIVGCNLQGNILILDDVLTSGITISESIKLIKQQKSNVENIIVSVNREEININKILTKIKIENNHKCKIYSIVNISDIILYLKNKNIMLDKLIYMQEYRNKYIY
ncbi:MAG: orotate phosphoribosyltransferase [Enterobacterales bacterium]